MFLAGALLSSIVVGAVLSGVGTHIDGAFRTGLLIVLAGIYLLNSLTSMAIEVPSASWQVPKVWRSLGRSRFSFLFGFFLGLGFVTIVSSWAYYVVLAGALLQSTPLKATAILAAFAVGRAAPVYDISLCLYRNETYSACLNGLHRLRKNVERIRMLLVTLLVISLLLYGVSIVVIA